MVSCGYTEASFCVCALITALFNLLKLQSHPFFSMYPQGTCTVLLVQSTGFSLSVSEPDNLLSEHVSQWGTDPNPYSPEHYMALAPRYAFCFLSDLASCQYALRMYEGVSKYL